MKFEYGNKTENVECVAYLHRMRGDDDSSASLAIKLPDGKVFTLYHDNSYLVQKDYEDKLGLEVIQKFYPGDKITITF